MNENLTYIERLINYLKQYRQIYGDTIYIDQTILLQSNISNKETNNFSDNKQEVFTENENILINDLDLFENEDTLKECKSLGEFKHLISGCQK